MFQFDTLTRFGTLRVMPDAAPSTAAPSPSQNAPSVRPNAPPPSHGEPDRHGWTRPEPKVSQASDKAPPPKKEAPAEGKEKPTSEKPDTEKEPAKAKTKEPEADDDPDEEWEDERGQKFKAKRSEIRKKFARAAEIERESHKRFQDSADARKKLAEEQGKLKTAIEAATGDPWLIQRAMLMHRDGLTEEQADAKLDEIAEARRMRQMQRERLTPEQQEAQRLKDENAQLKADKEKREADEKKARTEKLRAEHKAQWDRVIGETMTEHKLPPTRRTAARVAKVISDHATIDPATGKVVSVPPAIAARIVRDEIHAELKPEIPHMLRSMPEVFTAELSQLAKADPAATIALLGPEVIKAVLASEAKKHRDFVPQGAPKSPAEPRPPPKQKVPLTLEEARRKNLGVTHY